MKKALTMITAALMAMCTAACDTPPAASSQAQAPASEAPAASPSAPAEEAPAGGVSGTVVYWSMWQETEPQAEILKSAIQRFTTANPDVQVEVEWSGRGVKDLVSAAVVAGEQVDIFDSDPMAFYQTDPDIMMDLTDFYASEAMGGGTKVADSVMAGLVDWDKTLSVDYADDTNRSVPYNPFCIDFFYNTDHFQKAGIDQMPQTWAELDDVCAKLKAAGFKPIVTIFRVC